MDAHATTPAATAATMRRRQYPAAWAAVAIAILAVLPYLNSLGGDFVFDDVGVIRDNPMVTQGPSLELLGGVYFGSAYRPFTMFTYALNHCAGAAPFGFHLVNVVLHALVALAFFLLARRLLDSLFAATVAAALFAVHPVHTEAVSNIVGRAELLAALFTLGALLALGRALHSPGRRYRRWLAVSLAAFAAGLLSKESAFTTIGLVLVVHWRLAPADGLRRRAAVLAPYVLVGLCYLGLHLLTVGSLALPIPPNPLDNPLAHVDVATRIRTAAVVLWNYLAILVAPLRLSADYSFNQVPLAQSWSEPRVLAALALLTALAAGALASWRRRPDLTVAAALFAVPMALTANLLFPIGTIQAERLLYLPSIGACLLLGWLLERWSAARPRAAGVAIAAILTLFALRTWARNFDWHDERTLYEATVLTAPESAKAHHNLGAVLERAGALDDAVAQYRRALEIYPDYAEAAFGIAHVASLRGDESTARHWYRAALQRDRALAKAHLQLGLMDQRHGDYSAAEREFTAGLESEPDDPMLLVNLAAVRLSRGDARGARALLARLDRLAPPPDRTTAAVVAAARREIEVALR